MTQFSRNQSAERLTHTEKNFDDFAEIFHALKLLGIEAETFLSIMDDIDKLPDHLWIHNEDNTIVYGNHDFIKNFNPCMKQTCYQCLMGEEKPCDCCLSKKAFATNSTQRCTLCKRYGKGYDLNIYHTPISNDRGQRYMMKSSFFLEETSNLANSLRLVDEKEGGETLYLSMCSACSRVRDKNDNWVSIDETQIDNGNVRISHGICPECRKILYPGY